MKLSAYTIAKNCSDLADVEAGIDEIKKYFAKCENKGEKPKDTAYIRFAKLKRLEEEINDDPYKEII